MAPFSERPSWTETPDPVRRRIEAVCASPVVTATDVHGGMSPGPAAILRLSDGRDVFVKAVSERASAGSHRAYVREAATLAAMPAGAPAPELLGHVREGDWFALVMSVAPGEPAGPPWTATTATLVTEACATLDRLPAPASVPRIADLLTDLDGWDRLADADADDWERRHRPALARRASGWPRWTAGETLVHQDIRADNTIVDRAAGRALLVDWSFGCAGAPWLDRARLAADIVCTGHRDGPAAALSTAISIIEALPAEAPGFVAALAGMWRYRSTLPPLPGHPTLRAWQRARARAIRPLLNELLTRTGCSAGRPGSRRPRDS